MTWPPGTTPRTGPRREGFPFAGGIPVPRPRLSHLLALTVLALAVPTGVRLASAWQTVLNVGRTEASRAAEATPGLDLRATAGREEAAGAIEPGAGPPTQAATAGAPSFPRPRDPLTAAAVERLAVELSRREGALLLREQSLASREAALAIAARRVQEQADRLASLQESVAQLVRQVSAEDQERAAKLSRIYDAMKPRNAAAILEQMSVEAVLPIVKSLREAKASAIVAAMAPDKARSLTAEMARKRPLPEPR